MADLIKWEDRFSVNNEIIDNQHKRLIDLLNELNIAIQSGSGQDDLISIVDLIVNDIKEHFETEEGFMNKADYKNFTEHKQEHDNLIRQALSVQAAFKSGKIEIKNDVLDFLNVWLLKHFEESDSGYKGKI